MSISKSLYDTYVRCLSSQSSYTRVLMRALQTQGFKATKSKHEDEPIIKKKKGAMLCIQAESIRRNEERKEDSTTQLCSPVIFL